MEAKRHLTKDPKTVLKSVRSKLSKTISSDAVTQKLSGSYRHFSLYAKEQQYPYLSKRYESRNFDIKYRN